jgi:hypothetical protein
MSTGNSWDALAWASRQRTGGPGPKALLLSLAKRADESWSCYPGQDTLADETEQSVRTVRDQLKKLEELGLIRRESRGRPGGGRTSDRYFLLVDGKPADPAAKGKPADLAGQTGNGLPVQTGNLLPGNSQGEQPDVEQPGMSCDSGALFDVDVTPKAPTGPAPDLPPFEDFWQAYPKDRRVEKKAAGKAYAAALEGVPLAERPALAARIIDGAKRYAKEREGQATKFTKHPTTWLNKGCWDDEPAAEQGGYRQYRDEDIYPDADPWFDPERDLPQD